MTSETRERTRKEFEEHGALARLRQRPIVLALIAGFVLIALAGTLAWWLNARHYESTDDAFIDTRSSQISTQISGAIVDVAVTDNQVVAPGDVLLRVDDRDYRAGVDQAEARVAQAHASISNLDAQIEAQRARVEQARKQVSEAQAALEFAEAENARAQDLVRRGAGTQQRAQQTQSDLTQRQAALSSAQANAAAAEKQIAVLQAQRQSARAQLDQAQAALTQARANLDRTVVVAPLAGRIAKISAAKGAYAQVGTALMMFVPQAAWVTANFKETQLCDMRPGQEADIRIDAYPGRSFRGHVASIQPGSGAAFSLLPPENATGNYVKVVQRVPVKITFDTPPDVYVGPGMSVVPTVKVR
jgi:membrane fusion protein (multidrug efflux system)